MLDKSGFHMSVESNLRFLWFQLHFDRLVKLAQRSQQLTEKQKPKPIVP